MSVPRVVGRLFSALVITIAKTIGGIGGAQTFGQDNARAIYKRPDDYRP